MESELGSSTAAHTEAVKDLFTDSAHCRLLIRNKGNTASSFLFFFLPSVSFISFLMCFSVWIRGHEYTKYPWGNVSRKHAVDTVKHEWLHSLLCCVCVSGVENEGQWNGSFRRWTEKKNKIKLYTYLTSVITSTSDDGNFYGQTSEGCKMTKWHNNI